MQPETALTTDLGQRLEWINGASHSGASGRYDRQTRALLILQAVQLRFQCSHLHAPSSIHRNWTNPIRAEPHDPSRFHQRHMGIVADQHHSIGGLIEAHAMTRGHQSSEIAQGSTAGRNSTSSLRQIKS